RVAGCRGTSREYLDAGTIAETAGRSARIHRRGLPYFRTDRPQGDPIRLHAIPVLDQEAVGLKQLPNARTLPSCNLFQDWHQYSQRVVTEDGPLCDLRDMLR